MPKVFCKICKKEFYAKPNHLKKGWGRHCSRSCQFKGQLKGDFVHCATCNKKIWRAPKDLKRSKSGKFFCTKSCQTLWRNKFYSGSNHPLWTGGKKQYRNVLLEKKSISVRCVECGYKKETVLVVHHKDGNRKNINVGNLQWLCRNCHYIIHSGKTV